MIYFVKVRNFIKIGCADDVDARLKTLQTANPEKIKLLAIMPGSYQTETGLHEAFHKYRKQGEWFRYEGLLKASLIMLRQNPTIDNVKDLTHAGMKLQVIQKRNRNPNYKKQLAAILEQV